MSEQDFATKGVSLSVEECECVQQEDSLSNKHIFPIAL